MEDWLIIVHDLPNFAAGRPAALLESRQPRYGFRRQQGAAKNSLCRCERVHTPHPILSALLAGRRLGRRSEKQEPST
jgi:hypothetical protein